MFEYQAIINNVVDGDTLDVSIDLGFKMATIQRIRLAHVDTPERGEPGFDTATDFVRGAALGKRVTLRTSKPSKYGYYLGEVTFEDGRSLADLLLTAGLARKYDGGKK